ncbi:MAG: twin-arginine translocase TatA/TatE family subunit [Bacteroidia bacterium]|nr:twin-arginine translocase TatA/TatE family subunit [Bacteroidia bacterium]NNC84467.1 twin-arginine translocase TatA/TatE family subunit [Bacteroidia bacterium]NNM16170.1 twin-arginine translocase TatA/TatE family subunit [Bacteroidia bacterium]
MINNLLFLNGLGTAEVALIVFVILIFFGSKRIPDLARGLGKGMREFKDAVGDVKGEVEKSMRDTEQEINKTINKEEKE